MTRFAVWVALVLAGGLTGGAVRAGERLALPPDVFYYQPAASVFGAEAIWINPAGLGRFDAAGFQIIADYYAGDYVKSWGWALHRDRLSSAYRHVNNPGGADYDEWLWAGGIRLGRQFSVGLSYRYFRNGPGYYEDRHLWTIGLASRGSGPFALGAVFSNLNRGRIDGARSLVEHRYSLGYRPFGNRLTLAVDMITTTERWADDAHFVYHAEYCPKPGLFLNAQIETGGAFQVGFRANLVKLFIGSRSAFDSHGHNGRTTVFIGGTNQRQASLLAEPKRQLTVPISGRPAENPPQPIFGTRPIPFLSYLAALDRAATDPSVGSLLVTMDNLSLGLGQAQELRDALRQFRLQGKRVICHIEEPNNISYYVASVADTILIPPVCELRLVGLRAELTFFAGTLDKLGVSLELLKVGEYKDAPEAYTRRSASDESREQTNRILDDLFDQFVAGIAEGRGLAPDSVRSLVDRGPYTSADALSYGLVDGLIYRDDLSELTTSAAGAIGLRAYLADTLLADEWQSPPVLAVVVAEGEIAGDRRSDDPLGGGAGVTPAPLARAFARARQDPAIRGVVLRINSPGGWALVGEEIHHLADKAAGDKPLVVSMANLAASAGYHIAMPARRLFADPATLTGSVGIYGGKLDLSGFYEKIDLTKELYTRGQFAGMLTTVRPFTDEEHEKYQSHLQAFYDHFVDLVAENRSLPADSVDRLSRGRVWTGRQALANGFVDELGGLNAALDYLARTANLETYRVKILPERRPWLLWPGRNLWRELLPLLGLRSGPGDEAAPSLPFPLTDDLPVLARLPYDIEIR